MRRVLSVLLKFLAVLLASLALAGCADSSTSTPASNTSSSTSTSSAASFPLSVATMFGNVKIAARPQRVVALGWADAETLYALGVQPVGVSDWLAFGGDGVGPWAQPLVKSKPAQLGTTEPNFEKIAALQPDLILNTRSDNNRTTYNTLSKIAPTVYGPSGVGAYGTSWRQQVLSVATAVGLKAEGERLIEKTTARFAEVSAQHPQLKGKTFAVGALYGTNQWGAYVSGDLRADFLTALGMVNAPAIESQKSGSFFIPVSPEKLTLLDADLTVMFAIGNNDAALRSNVVLKNLPSARSGHLLVLDQQAVQAYSDGSVLAIDYALTHVAPTIIATATS